MASVMNPRYLSGRLFRMSSTELRKYSPKISDTNSTSMTPVPPAAAHGEEDAEHDAQKVAQAGAPPARR